MIVAFLCQPQTRCFAHFQRNAFSIQLSLQFDDELIHHLLNNVSRQMVEPNDVIQTVTELWREHLLDLFHRVGAVILLRKAN